MSTPFMPESIPEDDLGINPTEISPEEITRYSRQLLLPQWEKAEAAGQDPQAALKAARVLVVGAGGLGCAAAAYLAGAGVGCLGLSDSDHVDPSNLHRQPLYRSEDVGKPKAEVAARELRALNPHITLHTHEALNADCAWANTYTLWLDCTDNPQARYLVHDRCTALGREWVWGAAAGMAGMVSVLGPAFGLRQLFPKLETPSCAETGVLGPVPGVVGAMMAAEAIKLLTGVGKPLRGQLLIYDAANASSRVLRLTNEK